MNAFKAHAYERAVVQELQRYLLDRFVAADTPAKASLTCEELPVAESQVPQECFMQVFHRLTEWDSHHRTAMNRFQFVETSPADALPFLKVTPKSEAPSNDTETDEPSDTRG